jgi:hypothetical protein
MTLHTRPGRAISANPLLVLVIATLPSVGPTNVYPTDHSVRGQPGELVIIKP